MIVATSGNENTVIQKKMTTWIASLSFAKTLHERSVASLRWRSWQTSDAAIHDSERCGCYGKNYFCNL